MVDRWSGFDVLLRVHVVDGLGGLGVEFVGWDASLGVLEGHLGVGLVVLEFFSESCSTLL